MTEREKMLMAAAYLQGMARGLASRATKTWHRRVMNSPLGTTTVFGTVDEIMRDGMASNPISVYKMRKMAEACGLDKPTHLACEMIQQQLTKP